MTLLAGCRGAPVADEGGRIDAAFVEAEGKDAAPDDAGNASDASNTADASDAASAETSPPPKFRSWKTPETIAELSESCSWKPDESDVATGRAPTMCLEDLFEQSCVPDPCASASETCATRCGKGCEGCAHSCVTRCDACEKPCTDDACRRACAATTAACEDACLSDRETCRETKCDPAYGACVAKNAARWDARGCSDACAALITCDGACNPPDAKPEAAATCAKTCERAFTAVCSRDFATLCRFVGPHPFGS